MEQKECKGCLEIKDHNQFAIIQGRWPASYCRTCEVKRVRQWRNKNEQEMKLKISCLICGENRMVEFHHIIRMKMGGPDESWNILMLCPTHHQILDIDRSLLIPLEWNVISKKVQEAECIFASGKFIPRKTKRTRALQLHRKLEKVHEMEVNV